ncbi:MAG: hypothetical protein JWN67_267 [Actinomycetia bacterium]|nr:hypothetical protein [Actinomycetes bacterium]
MRVPDVDVDLYLENVVQLGEALPWLWVVLGDDQRDLALTAEGAARIEDLLQQYGSQRQAIAAQAEAAEQAGRSTFTLEVELPEGASADVEQLLDLLELVSRMVGEEGLASPASPKINAFRRFLLGEVARQLRAGPAR